MQHSHILNRNLSPQTQFLHGEGSDCCECYPGRSNCPLKSPPSSSEEIHSSCGCMCQISLVLALATAESSPSDECVLGSVTNILFSCAQDIKQCPLSTKKQIEGTGLMASIFFSTLFVRQEDWVINALAMCSCSCNPAGKYLRIYHKERGWCFQMKGKKRSLKRCNSKP